MAPLSEEDAVKEESIEDKDKDKEKIGNYDRVGEEREGGGEGKNESILSVAFTDCSDLAAIAEYDVIDFCIKSPLPARTPVHPLRGAGRGGRGRTFNRNRYREKDKDRVKRGKINEGLRSSEMVSNEDRDQEIERSRKGQGDVEGEGGSTGSRSLTGLEKPLYLHSSPLLALCSSDHVRHHTDFRYIACRPPSSHPTYLPTYTAASCIPGYTLVHIFSVFLGLLFFIFSITVLLISLSFFYPLLQFFSFIHFLSISYPHSPPFSLLSPYYLDPFITLTYQSIFSALSNLTHFTLICFLSNSISSHWEELLGDRFMRAMQGNVPEGYGREEMEGDDTY